MKVDREYVQNFHEQVEFETLEDCLSSIRSTGRLEGIQFKKNISHLKYGSWFIQ